MFNYLSYDNEQIDLIKKCARMHKRSLSKGKIVTKDQNKGDEFEGKMELEGTKRLEKKLVGLHFDEASTHKKYGKKDNKNSINAISEFSIIQEQKVQKYFLHLSNLKLNAYQNKQYSLNLPQETMVQRINKITTRIDSVLTNSHRYLEKTSVYAKYLKK